MMLRKAAILTVYIIGYWVILPFCLVGFSFQLDRSLHFTPVKSTLLVVAGIILLLIAVPFLVISICQFKKFGREFPVSATPPAQIIRKGVFSVWSHPIYLFYSLLFLGIAMIWGSQGMLLIIMPLFAAMVCLYATVEERILMKRFGNSYRNHLNQVSRIIPDLYFLLKIPGYLFFKSAFFHGARNRENIPDSLPFFLVSSHRNYLDPLLIALSFPYRISYVTTYEMFRKPLPAYFFRKMGCIPKRRYLNDIHAAKRIMQLVEEERVIGFFPEGERSWTGEMSSFKPETLNLFRKLNHVPILPVKIEGNFYAWPRWGKGIRQAKIVVTFQPPVTVDPGMEPSEIERLLTELTRPGDDRKNGFACYKGKYAVDFSMIIYRCPLCSTFDSLRPIDHYSLVCNRCGESFRMDQYYRVHFTEAGDKKSMSLDTLYERIRIREEDTVPMDEATLPEHIQLMEDDKPVTYMENCRLYRETGNKFLPLFMGTMTLSRKGIYFSSREHSVMIPYDSVGAVTIESNFRLQLYDTGKRYLYQVPFQSTSARRWQDYIVAIMKASGHALPVTR